MKPELKKLLVLNLPYLLFVYLFAKCGQAYRLAAGADASAKLLHLTGGISVAFASPLPSLHSQTPCFRPQAAFRNKAGRQPEKGSGPQQTTRNGGLTMNFSVEEENLICMYHTSDRRRTMARMLAALPDMDTEMRRLANGTIAKLERMTDADFDGQRFDFTGE